MKKLPKPDQLIVQQTKLVGYLLNLNHVDGASKAKFFLSRGFERGLWPDFAAALINHGASQPVVNETATVHGMKYVVECNLETPDGRNPCIRSVWIVEGCEPPRLATAYPNS
ncbi:MAG: hypothetical protein NVS9B10_16660 [Nevskia sp.]